MYLSLDRNLVGGDEVIRSSSFPTCHHDDGHGCCSAVLRGDHHCDVVWWSTWSELSGATRDVVDMRSAEPLGTACSIGDGVGAVGTAFAADGVFVVVIGLCGDLTWTCTKYQMLCKKW